MADDKDEEYSDNSRNSQLRNPSDELIPVTDTEDREPAKPKSRNRKYGSTSPSRHSSQTPKVERVFSGILMIFSQLLWDLLLRTFGSTLQIVQGKQYIAGFIRNLKDDTANLRQVIEFDEQQVKGLDSMLKLAHAIWRSIPIENHFIILPFDIYIVHLFLK